MLTFQEALQESKKYNKRHVLLGNGFSIACRPNIFVYGRLFERADFSNLSVAARNSFESLNTQDFEQVIKALRYASSIVSLYKDVRNDLSEQMLNDANGLREVLVNTIASSHPEMPGDITEDEYAACKEFLKHFNVVYTLNYDLLLYWTQMHTKDGKRPTSDDGFRKPDYDYEAEYVTWEPHQSHEQNMWFLHGALHVFDAGDEVQKYTWVNTGVRLIEQIRDALSRDYFPLFVAEGTSEEKVTRIRHSDYLAKAYRSFSEIQGALFIYGHSLASNDAHFIRRIEKGKVKHVFVGIYGDPTSKENRAIMARANRMIEERGYYRKLLVSFYNSESAKVWG